MLLLASEASPHSGTAPPGSFHDLRACSYSTFSRALNRCTKREQDSPITSNKVICSATLVARRTVTVRERWFFDGELDYAFKPTVFGPGTHPIWITYDLRTALPVPGGTWRCEFGLGTTTAGLTFQSGGPTGKVIDTSVCRGERRLGRTRCITDDSVAPIPTSTTILCEGI